jgi:hypothetical protein
LTEALRDWLVEIDPNRLRVGFIDLDRERCARLHAGQMDELDAPLNGHIVRFAADKTCAVPVSAEPLILGFLNLKAEKTMAATTAPIMTRARQSIGER